VRIRPACRQALRTQSVDKNMPVGDVQSVRTSAWGKI
jgi:hypothetical protein